MNTLTINHCKCGHQAKPVQTLAGQHYVTCSDMDCTHDTTGTWPTVEQAVAEWNRLNPSTTPQIAEATR